MKDILSKLEGKKTYISAIAGGVCVVLYFLKWIDGTTLEALLGAFGFAGLASVRSAIEKK